MSNPLDRLKYGWHLRRTITKIIRKLKDDVVRQGTSKAMRYKDVNIGLKFGDRGIGFRLSGSVVARVIEKGFKSYNWGLRVLENNKGNKNKRDKTGRPYRVISIKDKILNKEKFFVVSEKSIMNSNKQKWRMPSRKGEGLMQKEFLSQKKAIAKEIRVALLKDTKLDLKRRLK